MLYNIALLHKKVIMLPFMESNALHYFLHYFLSPGLGLLICFLIIKKKKKNSGPFTPKVKLISLRLKEVPLYLTSNCSQHGDRRGVSE